VLSNLSDKATHSLVRRIGDNAGEGRDALGSLVVVLIELSCGLDGVENLSSRSRTSNTRSHTCFTLSVLGEMLASSNLWRVST
jgi:hypothetical protein